MAGGAVALESHGDIAQTMSELLSDFRAFVETLTGDEIFLLLLIAVALGAIVKIFAESKLKGGD